MPKNWDELATASEVYTPGDFQAAAYQLVTEQVLYASVPGQSVSYALVSRYLGQFKEAMGLLGIDLIPGDGYRFIAAVPREIKRGQLSIQQTLLVLVMRQAYHDQMLAGITEHGCAVVTIEEMLAAYKDMGKRDDLPSTSAQLREVLKPLQRFGMVRIDNVDGPTGASWQIRVLPGIEVLVSEPVLVRMASAYAGENDGSAEGEQGENAT